MWRILIKLIIIYILAIQMLSNIVLAVEELVIVETHSPESIRVKLSRVVDGDTIYVVFNGGSLKVRIVGYDAWELDTPLGYLARSFIMKLCGEPGSDVWIDIDDLESRDRYGRILAYVWCGENIGEYRVYASIPKAFLIANPQLVEKPLYIEPDEYPYMVWFIEHRLMFEKPYNLVILNTSTVIDGNVYMLTSDRIDLNGGFYSIYLDGELVTLLDLTSLESIELNIDVESLKQYSWSTINIQGRNNQNTATLAIIILIMILLIIIILGKLRRSK